MNDQVLAPTFYIFNLEFPLTMENLTSKNKLVIHSLAWKLISTCVCVWFVTRIVTFWWLALMPHPCFQGIT